MMSPKKFRIALLAVSLSFLAFSCKKPTPVQTQTPPPPQPPPPPAPVPAAVVRSFTVEPTTITAGQSATLTWAVENADSVTISGLGTVQGSGSRNVSPQTTTTYSLAAAGRGGNANRSVTLTVRPVPPPPPPPERTVEVTLEEMVRNSLSDAYFDYDKSEVRDDARSVLNRNGEALKSIFAKFPNAIITIEGHCDERGSAEYNLGLGDRRSTAAKEYLINLGVPGDKLKVISYGNEKPQCSDANEGCWQKNRRAHFSAN
jgi:peptidoglycan-associated lipoprotein